ncbi:MAG: BMC domain-containing protein [Armatimonadetes bacterium]|nr:BMC domain-containing protein [Armatimonadota bacterium]
MSQEAVGLVETVGLVSALAAADAGAKAAGVDIARRLNVKGAGRILVIFEGEVAAVQAAVDAACNEARRVGQVAAAHVIPRPAAGLDLILGAGPAPQPPSRRRRGKAEDNGS